MALAKFSSSKSDGAAIGIRLPVATGGILSLT